MVVAIEFVTVLDVVFLPIFNWNLKIEMIHQILWFSTLAFICILLQNMSIYLL